MLLKYVMLIEKILQISKSILNIFWKMSNLTSENRSQKKEGERCGNRYGHSYGKCAHGLKCKYDDKNVDNSGRCVLHGKLER